MRSILNKIIIILMMVVISGVIYADVNGLFTAEVVEIQDEEDNSLSSKFIRVEQRIENIYKQIGTLQTITIHNSDDVIRYELSYAEVNGDNLKSTNKRYGNYLVHLSKNIRDVWVYAGVDKSVEISILDSNNLEVTLLSALDGELTFNSLTYRDAEATREDWIQCYEYRYGHTPSSKELEQFIEDHKRDLEE